MAQYMQISKPHFISKQIGWTPFHFDFYSDIFTSVRTMGYLKYSWLAKMAIDQHTENYYVFIWLCAYNVQIFLCTKRKKKHEKEIIKKT